MLRVCGLCVAEAYISGTCNKSTCLHLTFQTQRGEIIAQWQLWVKIGRSRLAGSYSIVEARLIRRDEPSSTMSPSTHNPTLSDFSDPCPAFQGVEIHALVVG